MGISRNELTGEVTLEAEGKTFVLRASFARVAEFQRLVSVPGMQAAMGLITVMDANALHCGLRALCGPGQMSDIDDLMIMKHLKDVSAAISTALTLGLPPVEDEGRREGKIEGSAS